MHATDAFSMVELLVVLVIIGILAGLVLGAVNKAKMRAHEIHCRSNLKQYAIYLQDFNARTHEYPLELYFEVKDGLYPNHAAAWIDSLFTDIKPTSKDFGGFPISVASIFRCPTATRPKSWPGDRGFASYGYNGVGVIMSPAELPIGLGRVFEQGLIRPVREDEVVNPSGMIAFADGIRGRNDQLHDGQIQVGMDNRLGDSMALQRVRRRHNFRISVAFCDGHVDGLTLPGLFNEANNTARSLWNRDGDPHLERK